MKKNSALANKKVRQAISLALNKEDFVAHFINNGAKPATGLVPVGHINEETGKDFRKENGNLSLYDVQSAKKDLGRSEKRAWSRTSKPRVFNV